MPFEIEHIRQPSKLYRNVRCSGCNAELKSAGLVQEDGAWTSLQPDDALVMTVESGYGMAVDTLGGDATESDLTIIFCRDCIPKLCDQWPAISKVVRENCSSSLGHHCSKVEGFVWRSYSDCCDVWCPACCFWASNDRIWEKDAEGYSKQYPAYHRFDIKCRRCGYEGKSIWGWERETNQIRKNIHDTNQHTECSDPFCCNCSCNVCRNVWIEKGRPVPKVCGEHSG